MSCVSYVGVTTTVLLFGRKIVHVNLRTEKSTFLREAARNSWCGILEVVCCLPYGMVHDFNHSASKHSSSGPIVRAPYFRSSGSPLTVPSRVLCVEYDDRTCTTPWEEVLSNSEHHKRKKIHSKIVVEHVATIIALAHVSSFAFTSSACMDILSCQ